MQKLLSAHTKGAVLNGGTTHPIVVNVLTAIMCGSLGFGGSQLLVVKDVTRNTQDIAYLREADAQIRREQTMSMGVLSDSISTMRVLFEKNLEAQRSLIEMLKVQNELLERQRK